MEREGRRKRSAVKLKVDGRNDEASRKGGREKWSKR